MKKVFLLLALIASSYGHSASFNCNKARSQNEHLICADSELSQLDDELGVVYAAAKLNATNKKAFQDRTVSEWRRRERECHGEKHCLLNWYSDRLGELTPLAYTNVVQEGIYIGANGKKLSLTSYQHEGTVQYQIVGIYPSTRDAIILAGSETKRLQINQSTTFVVPDEPYNTENPTNYCQFRVTATNGKLMLRNNRDCSGNELLFSGQYAYSAKFSSIPAKYQGAWGEDCSEPSFIKKDSFSGDGWHQYEILSYEGHSNGAITLYGYGIDEGFVIAHHILFSPRKNGNMDIKIQYDKPYVLLNQKKCW